MITLAKIVETVEEFVSNSTVNSLAIESKSPKILGGLRTIQTGYAVSRVVSMLRDTMALSVTIPRSSNSYAWTNINALVTDGESGRDPVQNFGVTSSGYGAIFIPATRRATQFQYNGFTYSAKWMAPKRTVTPHHFYTSAYDDTPETEGTLFESEERLVITTYSRKAMDTLMDYLKEIFSDEQRRNRKTHASVYVRNAKWNEFRRTSRLRPRDLSSIVLKEGQIDRLVGYIQNFKDQEDEYARLGIPYRTGIMLYGPPGTGKTSIVTGIATHFNTDLYILSLSSIKTSEDLHEMFRELPEQSILLLEDIDVATSAATQNEATSEGITPSDLLNAIDGVASPHGLITVMTTNNRESILPALLRPGRIDLQEHITAVDTQQLRGILNTFTEGSPEVLPEITVEDSISPASIIGVIREHLNNKEEQCAKVMEFVKAELDK